MSAGRNAIAQRALREIERELSEPGLTPAGIAGRTGISLRYLQKLFEELGEPPNRCIRRLRLRRARQDLGDPLYADQSIAEIGRRWGFADAGYFSRSFRAFYGLPPSAFRQAAVELPLL